MKIHGHGSSNFYSKFILEWLNWPKHQLCQVATNGFFFCRTVNFIIQNWRVRKNVQLVVCHFFWWEVNLQGFRGNSKQINLIYAVLYCKPHWNGRRFLISAAGVLIFVVILALLSKYLDSAHQLNENGWQRLALIKSGL